MNRPHQSAVSGVTQLLLDWREGDAQALDKLTPIVYQELRRLARGYMRREAASHVLQTTALVHEAYLRLVGEDVAWEGRNHFFAVAARMMRRILVDFARRGRAKKRGGEMEHLSLEEAAEGVEGDPGPNLEILALDNALKKLAAFDERKSRVVELRFFGGMTIRETAEVMELSHATIERELKVARAWLSEAMG